MREAGNAVLLVAPKAAPRSIGSWPKSPAGEVKVKTKQCPDCSKEKPLESGFGRMGRGFNAKCHECRAVPKTGNGIASLAEKHSRRLEASAQPAVNGSFVIEPVSELRVKGEERRIVIERDGHAVPLTDAELEAIYRWRCSALGKAA